ncbi:TetR-like C-terminal domain-containing protein [Nocardia sp. NPDC051570]|uniref:TetR-like C-terminal domain-containing protein n=1 Tax=Nocardia sp. NPDC051570 TaxID=3364324 RepID=UPI003787BBCB
MESRRSVQWQTDPATAELLAAFARDRRGILHRILEQAQARGELAVETDRELVIDQVYGVLWYRLTVARTPLDAETAARLANSLLKH